MSLSNKMKDGHPRHGQGIYFCIWFRNCQTLYKFHMEKNERFFPKCSVEHGTECAQIHVTCMQVIEYFLRKK